MSALFRSDPFSDPELGELSRSGGAWRGQLTLPGAGPVPLVIAGPRAGPDPEALRLGRTIAPAFADWRPMIAQALYEHLEPYAAIEDPSAVWAHATPVHVSVLPLDGILTIEIGYQVAWDEEHTLGARIRNGALLELCGSVLAP